jgi:hypothetical protein
VKLRQKIPQYSPRRSPKGEKKALGRGDLGDFSTVSWRRVFGPEASAAIALAIIPTDRHGEKPPPTEIKGILIYIFIA